jgi:hypothetical protein
LVNGRSPQQPIQDIEKLYREIARETYFVDDSRPPLPRLLLLDELMGRRAEALARR